MMKTKSLIIIVVVVLLALGLFAVITFAPAPSGSNTSSTFEASEDFIKADLVDIMRMGDAKAASAYDVFADLGLNSYESLERGGVKGNMTLHADGFNLDCMVRGDEVDYIYIGDVCVYKGKTVSIPETTVFVTYDQFRSYLQSYANGIGVKDELSAYNSFKSLEELGFTLVSNVKDSKEVINGSKVSGFSCMSGSYRLFITVSADGYLNEAYMLFDTLEPIPIYPSGLDASELKVAGGVRMALSSVMAYKFKTIGYDDAIFPAALITGDDSYEMLHYDGKYYVKCLAETVKSGKSQSKEYLIVISDGDERELLEVYENEKKVFPK